MNDGGRLQQKVAIVTGASQGIGRATVVAFARAGARVCGVARSEELLLRLRDELKGPESRFLAMPGDVRKDAEIKEAVDRTLNEFGRIDILVNAAGVAIFKPVEETAEADWDATVDTNLKGSFLCSKHVVPHMLDQGRGDIVNIASIAGHVGFAASAAYCASKAGILGLSRALSVELRKRGIRVITVTPGAVDTWLWNSVDSPPDRSRMVRAQEIADVIVGVLTFSERAIVDEIIVTPPEGIL